VTPSVVQALDQLVTFEYSQNTLQPNSDRMVFVAVSVPCPTTGAEYAAMTESSATASNLVTAQTSFVPIVMSFSAVTPGTELRLCVLHNQVTNSFSEYPHVRIMTATDAPTGTPTNAPTTAPSTSSPTSASPTSQAPSASPTTVAPTVVTESPVTSAPVDSPTNDPTVNPTAAPTSDPTSGTPSVAPTPAPTTVAPTATPTSAAPSAAPTESPVTDSPTSAAPTKEPTASPVTGAPTNAPTTVSPTKDGETFSPTTQSPTPLPRFQALACDGQPFRVLCPVGTKVTLESAVWGRTDKFGGLNDGNGFFCGLDRTDDCAQDVTAELQNYCGDGALCETDNGALSTFFSGLAGASPCASTFKYLNYVYTCAP